MSTTHARSAGRGRPREGGLRVAGGSPPLSGAVGERIPQESHTLTQVFQDLPLRGLCWGPLGNKWPRQRCSATLKLGRPLGLPWYRVSEIQDSSFYANCPFGRREIFIVKVPSLGFFFKHLIKIDMIHENNQSPKRQILVKKN